MTSQARITHQVLNILILHKLGSKDSISALHEFLQVNLLSQRKINLPAVLFENFKKFVNRREKLTVIPYGPLLQRVLKAQGALVLLNKELEEEKEKLTMRIKQAELRKMNFVRMNLLTLQTAMEKMAKSKKASTGPTKEDAQRRVAEIKRETTSLPLAKIQEKKQRIPKKRVRKLIIHESDDEEAKETSNKRTKIVYKSESTRKRTRAKSNKAEDSPPATGSKRTRSQVKGKFLSRKAEAASSAREKRTKRKQEQKVSTDFQPVSSIADLSEKGIETAISSAITSTLDDNVVVSEASVPVVDESIPNPPLSNPPPLPIHSPQTEATHVSSPPQQTTYHTPP